MKRYDPAFDDNVPGIISCVPLNRKFVTDHPLKEVSDEEEDTLVFTLCLNSLVIFDDFTKIGDKSIQAAVMNLKNAIFELGRQYRHRRLLDTA